MSSPTPTQNNLLAALPAADYERLVPDLEQVPLPLGMSVYESGAKLDYVYFPTDCIVSLLYVMKSGASAEIAVVAMKAWSASRCSWVGNPHPAVPWCKAPATRTGFRR